MGCGWSPSLRHTLLGLEIDKHIFPDCRTLHIVQKAKRGDIKKLKALSEKTGAPVSALIRKAIEAYTEEAVAGKGMRLTRELTKVVKAEVVSILKGYPAGLKAVQLYSMQWRSFPGAPSLQEFMDLLRELQTDGTPRERHVPGKFRIWQLGDQTEQT